eukprot:scaffold305270_cov23-Tisochrysis_lutea.AAC.1
MKRTMRKVRQKISTRSDPPQWPVGLPGLSRARSPLAIYTSGRAGAGAFSSWIPFAVPRIFGRS